MSLKSFLGSVVFACVAAFAHAELASNPQPLKDHSLPAKPIFTKVAATSLFEIDLQWRDKSTNEDGFQIERSADKINFRQIAQVLPGTTVYRDRNLFPGTRYYYRIRAFNDSGSSGNSTASARTPSPARPLTIVTWGDQIAIGTNAPDVVSVAEGYNAALVLHKNGTVTVVNDIFHLAQPPTNLTDVVAISAGYNHYLALKSDGTVVQWGSFFSGFETPMPTNLTGVVAIATGTQHCLALKGDGTVVGWGVDFYSQATPPPNLSGVVAIAAGSQHSLALKSDGSVVEWGYYLYPPPTNLPPSVAIAAANNHSFVIDANGAVTAWGDDYSGVATLPTNFTDVVSIAAGRTHTEALKKDGTIVSSSDYGYYPFQRPDLGGGAVAISTSGDQRAALSISPASPSHLQAKVLSARRFVLSWQDNSTGESSFQIERATNGTSPNWKRLASLNHDTTDFTDNGLAPNIVYIYRVRAVGPFGTSPYCEPIAVIADPLAKPQLNDVSLGSNDVVVSWFDMCYPQFIPNYIPFSGMDGFKIERAPNIGTAPGPWTEIGSVPPGSIDPTPNAYYRNYFTFHDTNVVTNSIYWYRVRAFNSLGVSEYSDPAAISVVVPFAPQSFSVHVVADQANLSWLSYQPSTEGFKIERAPDVNGTPGAWLEITNLSSIFGTYTESGFSVNTTWWYRMRAFNWVGDSPYTDPISVTFFPPSAPAFNGIYLAASNTVHLIWYDLVLGADGYKLERAPDVSGQPGDWTQIHISHVGEDNSNAFDDTNVVVNATYWYRVKSFNVLGDSDYSAPANISIVPPPAPSLSLSVNRNRVDLWWYFEGNGLVGFKVERAPDLAGSPGQWTQIALLPTNNYTPNSYTDTNLSPDTTYWYRVRAYNWAGDSPYSDPISATILPPHGPSEITAILGDTNQVNLLWNGNFDDDGFYIESAPDAGGVPGLWTQIGSVPINSYQSYNYTDTNITANTTNWYRVRAYSVTGVSDYNQPARFAIIPPGIPILGVNLQANRALLAWDEENNSDEEMANYVIERAPDFNGSPGAWTRIAAPAKGVYYFIDPSGTAGLTAWYRIQAETWVGSSPFCDPIAVTFVPPSQPLALSRELGTTNQLRLFWNDGSCDDDGFEIERAPDTNGLPGTWTRIGSLFATNAGYAEFIDTNVIANTTNWYRVRAVAGNDVSVYTTPLQVAILPPAAPTLYGSVGDIQVYLSWSDPDYYSAGIAGFKIERAADAGGNPGTWLALTNIGGTEYTDFAVSRGSTYWYRVRAYNWVGDSADSEAINVSVPAPEVQVPLITVPRPAHLLSVTLTNGGALIRWSTVGSGPDVVQAANDFTGNYTDISPALTIESTGTVITNYFDADALTNASRLYRIRSSR